MLVAMIAAGGIGIAIGACLMAFSIWQWRDYKRLQTRMLGKLAKHGAAQALGTHESMSTWDRRRYANHYSTKYSKGLSLRAAP